jgi:hypothetical protein
VAVRLPVETGIRHHGSMKWEPILLVTVRYSGDEGDQMFSLTKHTFHYVPNRLITVAIATVASRNITVVIIGFSLH